MDVLDPREVMAHGNKVPNGPSSEQLERLFEEIFRRYPKASAIGFATIPPTDEGGLSIAALNRMIAGAVRGVRARPYFARCRMPISLVIPAYNEARSCRGCSTRSMSRAARFTGGRDAIEVIVADNGSTDETAAIASARGCRVATVTKRVIGASRNGGAAIAVAPILCFVDADMQVHPDSFTAIAQAMADRSLHRRGHRRDDGALVGRASRSHSPMVLPLVWLTGMDTGVVFMRRADFDAIGGYAETRHFAEDVDFLFKLIRRGGHAASA